MFAYNFIQRRLKSCRNDKRKKALFVYSFGKGKRDGEKEELSGRGKWLFSPPSCLRSVPGRVALGSPTWRNSQCFCLCFWEEITVPSNPIPTCGDPVVSRGPLGWNRPSLQSQLSLGYLWHGRWAEKKNKKQKNTTKRAYGEQNDLGTEVCKVFCFNQVLEEGSINLCDIRDWWTQIPRS